MDRACLLFWQIKLKRVTSFPRFVSRLPEQGDMMPMQPNMYQVEKLLGPEY